MVGKELISLYMFTIFPIDCKNSDTSTTGGSCVDGDVRVANGSAQAGRMEICINNAWGTVCGDLFGPQDAAVACTQLGGFQRSGT